MGKRYRTLRAGGIGSLGVLIRLAKVVAPNELRDHGKISSKALARRRRAAGRAGGGFAGVGEAVHREFETRPSSGAGGAGAPECRLGNAGRLRGRSPIRAIPARDALRRRRSPWAPKPACPHGRHRLRPRGRRRRRPASPRGIATKQAQRQPEFNAQPSRPEPRRRSAPKPRAGAAPPPPAAGPPARPSPTPVGRWAKCDQVRLPQEAHVGAR